MKLRAVLLCLTYHLQISMAQVLISDTAICLCKDLHISKACSYLTDSCLPFTGKCRKYDSANHLISEYPYSNGKRTGKAQQWYPEGRLKCSETYYKGKTNIDYTVWYPNGKLKQIGVNQSDYYPENVYFDRIFGGYTIPLPYGGITFWYENGNIGSHHWNDTVIHASLSMEWDSTGHELLYSEFYEKELKGHYIHYYKNGNKKSEELYEQRGLNIMTYFYENGQKADEFRYLYDSKYEKTGTKRYWTSLGKPDGKEKWKHGKLLKSTRADREKKPGEYP
jgi:antitoxin component YwqK of YwqJK toxin-antitoxin module